MIRTLISVLAVSLVPIAAMAAERPNVIVILADDLGYSDLGVQGGKDVPTPQIDSIAKGGIRFTRGYVSGPYCSPTRAGLLTGRYQTRFGHEFNEGGGNRDIFGLPLGENTFADRMKILGYATAAVGKWHLGYGPEFRPMKRGFDEFYGTLANTPFFHPQLVDSRLSPDPKRVDDAAFYTTDAYAERAVDIIQKNKDRPFFLYLPFNACHVPIQATEKYLDRFKNVEDKERRGYAAMLSALDDAVGRVLTAVRSLKLEDRTLIFFCSDNGGPMTKMGQNGSNNRPLRGQKGDTWEGGVRVPFFVQWKGQLPAGKLYDHPVIQLDILPTAHRRQRGRGQAGMEAGWSQPAAVPQGRETGQAARRSTLAVWSSMGDPPGRLEAGPGLRLCGRDTGTRVRDQGDGGNAVQSGERSERGERPGRQSP